MNLLYKLELKITEIFITVFVIKKTMQFGR